MDKNKTDKTRDDKFDTTAEPKASSEREIIIRTREDNGVDEVGGPDVLLVAILRSGDGLHHHHPPGR